MPKQKPMQKKADTTFEVTMGCYDGAETCELVGINERLASLSSDKASFNQAAPPYKKALDECGYRYTLHYEPATTKNRKNIGTTYSGTTPHSAKTSAPIPDTDFLP